MSSSIVLKAESPGVCGGCLVPRTLGRIHFSLCWFSIISVPFSRAHVSPVSSSAITEHPLPVCSPSSSVSCKDAVIGFMDPHNLRSELHLKILNYIHKDPVSK